VTHRSSSCSLECVATRPHYARPRRYTEQLAEAIATGARTVIPEANVRVQNVNETSVPDDVLTWADGILLGSPTYFGNPAAGLLSWVDTAWEPFWTDPRFSQKYGAAFATGGGMAQGVEHVNS
jgi:NAD(P)H dehydrogenase (quinone)